MIVPSSTRVGILVIRRAGPTAWQPWAWRAVAMVPAAANADWTLLLHVDDADLFYATTLELTLDAAEGEAYRRNLAADSPAIYVVSRSVPADAEEPPLRPIHVTASPDEAKAHADGGEYLVEAVSMPISIAAWVTAFADESRSARLLRRRRHAGAVGDMRPRAGPIIVPPVYRPPGHQ